MKIWIVAAFVGWLALGTARAAEVNTNANLIYYDAVGNETFDPAEPQSNSGFPQEV